MTLEDDFKELEPQAIRLADVSDYSNLFNRYYAGLCGFAEKIIGDNYAEDIVGDVFLKLWEGKYVFCSELHLKAFLYRAVKNGCLNLIKMTGRAEDRHLFYQEEIGGEENTFLLAVTQAEVVRELHLAINDLPPQAGRIIKLTYLDGLSNQEAADHLGLSIQTVKNQKLRGLGILKKRLPGKTLSLLLLLPYFACYN
ncbi:sigma-70 family RNA polymerase sigma factor [Pedobacter sp. PLR]|uniref:RNA polymerase sigma factor n=1 Tax=Pedobacter sp. PLR TaxID=2994465 RepID=UPI0022485CEF|nr:sigma-70 family RNA polymerase sigma factor [Pedobacter sp. PLR]MCX2454033.1 sigma-70 family RNA polymerase sigma factor [Pedobacter sp. PLR]